MTNTQHATGKRQEVTVQHRTTFKVALANPLDDLKEEFIEANGYDEQTLRDAGLMG